MRLLIGFFFVLSVTSVVLVGCGDDQDPDGAKRLLREVRADGGYRMWERAPGYETRRSSNAPHGGAVDIYVNDVVADALANETGLTEWPLGSILVKDGFDDGDLELIAIMDKREDGWFWAEYDSDGDSIYSGKPDLCINCHQRGADHVRAFPLP